MPSMARRHNLVNVCLTGDFDQIQITSLEDVNSVESLDNTKAIAEQGSHTGLDI